MLSLARSSACRTAIPIVVGSNRVRGTDCHSQRNHTIPDLSIVIMLPTGQIRDGHVAVTGDREVTFASRQGGPHSPSKSRARRTPILDQPFFRLGEASNRAVGVDFSGSRNGIHEPLTIRAQIV